MDQADQFIPHLCVSDGLAAMAFYKSVFRAEEDDRILSPDGNARARRARDRRPQVLPQR